MNLPNNQIETIHLLGSEMARGKCGVVGRPIQSAANFEIDEFKIEVAEIP